MADIVLINPRFKPSYWGMNYALPFLGGEALLPVISLPLLAALTPPGHESRSSTRTSSRSTSSAAPAPTSSASPA